MLRDDPPVHHVAVNVLREEDRQEHCHGVENESDYDDSSQADETSPHQERRDQEEKPRDEQHYDGQVEDRALRETVDSKRATHLFEGSRAATYADERAGKRRFGGAAQQR